MPAESEYEIGRFPTQCGHCGGHPELVVVLDLGPLLKPVTAINRRLARIEAELGIIHHEQEHDMAELDDRLADLQAAEDTNTAKLARLIADFENAGTLTPEQTAALDALKAEIVGNSDAIDAADPELVPPTV